MFETYAEFSVVHASIEATK